MEIPSDNDLDSNGQLPREFIKLGEDDMSELAKYCREAGLEHMLFVCLEIFDKKYLIMKRRKLMPWQIIQMRFTRNGFCMAPWYK